MRRAGVGSASCKATQARQLRTIDLQKAERARVLGYAPPGKETFGELVPRYLHHQKARLTAKAFDRTRGVMEGHLRHFFGHMRVADVKRIDVQRYITARSAHVGPASVIKEINTLITCVEPGIRLVGIESARFQLDWNSVCQWIRMHRRASDRQNIRVWRGEHVFEKEFIWLENGLERIE